MNETLYIGVVGSRRRDTDKDYQIVRNAVLDVIDSNPDYLNYILVSGGCPQGADRFVDLIAAELDLPMPHIHYPDKSSIDKSKHGRWEYARICFERNTLIARDSDVLIACVAEDRKGGTEDTVKKFKKLHKERLLRDATLLIELEVNNEKDDVDRIC